MLVILDDVVKQFSSVCPPIWASERTDASQYPNETDRHREAYKRLQTAALAMPPPS